MRTARKSWWVAVRSVVMSLVLGLVTTLVVAGLLGWYRAFGGPGLGFKRPAVDGSQWRIVERMEFPCNSFYQAEGWSRENGFRLRSASEVREEFRRARWEPTELQGVAYSFGGPDVHGFMIEWGWPVRCLWGAAESCWRGSTTTATSLGLYQHVRQIDANTTESYIVPYAPIPAGLAIDAVIFGTPWWLALFGVRRFRRWNRIRRGRCVHCNYDLAGLTPVTKCPECGR